jgi:hypothetical protein
MLPTTLRGFHTAVTKDAKGDFTDLAGLRWIERSVAVSVLRQGRALIVAWGIAPGNPGTSILSALKARFHCGEEHPAF